MISKSPPGVDMGPEAVDRRLRSVSELYQFATTLKDVRWLGRARDVEEHRPGQSRTHHPGNQMKKLDVRRPG